MAVQRGSRRQCNELDIFLLYPQVDGCNVKLSVFDTAGQERFKAITSSFIRGKHGIVLVYDLSDLETLQSCLDIWVPEIIAKADPEAQIMLVGNKSDLVNTSDPNYEQDQKRKNQLIE